MKIIEISDEAYDKLLVIFGIALQSRKDRKIDGTVSVGSTAGACILTLYDILTKELLGFK